MQKLNLPRAVRPVAPREPKERKRRVKRCLPEHELPFHLPEGDQPCAVNLIHMPKYYCIELPKGSIIFKGVNAKTRESVPCNKFDSNMSWFSNMSVASAYELRNDRPRYKTVDQHGKTVTKKFPCAWATTKTLLLMDLTNVSNMRNFLGDLLQHINETYRNNETEKRNEIQKQIRRFKQLFGVNPLLGESTFNRDSVVDDDMTMFNNFCDIIGPRHGIDGYIAWAMNSRKMEWEGMDLFHQELMLCNPMSKIRELNQEEESRLLNRANEGRIEHERIRLNSSFV